MRMVTALLLLVSVLTTHAVALERASTKALDFQPQAAMPVTGEAVEGVLAAALDGDGKSASDSTKGPCLKNGDCVFLLPTHRFRALSPPLAHGGRSAMQPDPYRAEGLEKPPIS